MLIYNLPESIRESDLEKLSFAVELSKAFYSTTPADAAALGGGGGGGTVPGSNIAGGGNGSNASLAAAAGGGGAGGSIGEAEPLPLQPGNMVWLIQRDFLQARQRQSAANMLGHSARLLLLLLVRLSKVLQALNPAPRIAAGAVLICCRACCAGCRASPWIRR